MTPQVIVSDTQRNPIPSRRDTALGSEYEPISNASEDRKTDESVSKSSKNVVISASLWTLIGYGSGQVLRLINNMILTYLLVPEVFGIMALINVFLQGLQMISEVGVSQSVIQSDRGNERDFLNTAWTIQAGRGLLIFLMAVGISPLLAYVYAEPRLNILLSIAAVSVLIDGLTTTAFHTARRHLLMGRLTIIEISSQLASAILMCIWAYYQPSIWALVAGSLLSPVVKVSLSYFLLPESGNRFEWDSTAARELFSFGKWIMVGMIVAFLAMQIDRILLGKLMDMRMLGIYSIALTLAMLPSMIVERLSAYVLFPVLSSINRSTSKQIHETILPIRSGVLTPGMVGTLCVYGGADWFFHTLYHENFSMAADVTRMLCLATWFMLLTKSIDKTLLAVGRSRALAMATTVKLIATTTFAIGGFYLGGMPGFCGGLALGAFSGHIALYPSLDKLSISCWQQDFRFTIITVAGMATLELIQDMTEMRNTGWGEFVAMIIPIACSLLTYSAVSNSFAVVKEEYTPELSINH